MRKLAITGGGGFVAGSVIQQAAADWEVHALSGKVPLAERPGLVWHTLDLKEPTQVRKISTSSHPKSSSMPQRSATSTSARTIRKSPMP